MKSLIPRSSHGQLSSESELEERSQSENYFFIPNISLMQQLPGFSKIEHTPRINWWSHVSVGILRHFTGNFFIQNFRNTSNFHSTNYLKNACLCSNYWSSCQYKYLYLVRCSKNSKIVKHVSNNIYIVGCSISSKKVLVLILSDKSKDRFRIIIFWEVGHFLLVPVAALEFIARLHDERQK